MSNAFETGFVKRAQELGLNDEQTISLFKAAADDDSSWLGRYLAQKALPNKALIENKSFEKQLAQHVMTGQIGPVEPFGSMIDRKIMLGGDKKEREKLLSQASKGKGYGESFGAGATPAVAPGALIGGGLGALMNAGNDSGHGMDTGNPILNALLGGVVGAGAGAAGSGLIGGLRGLASNAVLRNTSNETKERAAKMVGRHPYATSLPFGDVIGAATG